MKLITRAAAALLLLPILLLHTAAAELIPVGRIIGLQLLDNTVTVAAFEDGCQACGLKIGDTIIAVNDIPVHNAEQVHQALEAQEGPVCLSIRRGSRSLQLKITPKPSSDGPKLGVYLRQGIAGIGTVTWYDPATGAFGALGHGVNDSGGCLLNMAEGTAYYAEVLSVSRGRSGHPGQLRGSAVSTACGELRKNTPQGIFGTNPSGWPGSTMTVASPDELHTGSASILSTVCGDTPQEYRVEILKLYPLTRTDGRNLLLKVTDPQLLEATGGIVQGMSGSPILQDGHLVGAVTHVLVNDPTMGYGIFIGNMLEAAA